MVLPVSMMVLKVRGGLPMLSCAKKYLHSGEPVWVNHVQQLLREYMSVQSGHGMLEC